MAQKAVRSEASSPNSLGPERDWPECVGRNVVPEPYSWLLEKWVVGESEEAGRPPLDQRRNRNKTKQKILLPALHRGKERCCSRRLLRKSKLQHLRLPASGPLRRLPGRLGAWLGRGGRRSPARGSMHRPMCRFGLGRSSSGGRRRAPTATGRLAWPRGQRWMVHHAGAGCAGSPRSAAVPPRTAGRSPRRCRRTALPGRWGHREACLVDVLHLCQVEPEMALLDHHGDIAFPRDRAVTFVARRAKSVTVRSSCINPGSVLPSCTCLSALAW